MPYTVSALGNHEDCAQFNPDGMEDAKRKNPDRPVSMMSLSARQTVDSAELRGLCFNRFQADITIECDKMPEKDAIIKAGEVSLGILQEGKTCWPECELFQNNLPCPLRDGVRYARVEIAGKLCQGEQFTTEKH